MRQKLEKSRRDKGKQMNIMNARSKSEALNLPVIGIRVISARQREHSIFVVGL